MRKSLPDPKIGQALSLLLLSWFPKGEPFGGVSGQRPEMAPPAGLRPGPAKGLGPFETGF
jgi:hypothetical protein